MGILRKAAIGSVLAGLGAVAITKNKKRLTKLKKSTVKEVNKQVKRALSSRAVKKGRRFIASKRRKLGVRA